MTKDRFIPILGLLILMAILFSKVGHSYLWQTAARDMEGVNRVKEDVTDFLCQRDYPEAVFWLLLAGILLHHLRCSNHSSSHWRHPSSLR